MGTPESGATYVYWCSNTVILSSMGWRKGEKTLNYANVPTRV